MSRAEPGRRTFLKGMLAAGLTVAIGPVSGTPAPKAARAVRGWVRIAPDGAVTVLSNTSEIGQGTGTALAQILADELDLDWNRISLEMAPLEEQFFNPRYQEVGTYGSGGVAYQLEPLRLAGAQARAMLVGAAAARWQAAPADCDTERGTVVHRASGRRLAYAELVEEAARQPVPADPPRMPRERLRYVGKEVARLDLPSKVDGSAVFGVDVRLPGLLSAAILQCPRFGGKLAGVDPGPALRLPGVRHVVRLDDAVAVVADDYWRAHKGLSMLRPRWNMASASRFDSAAHIAALRQAVEREGPQFVPPGHTQESVNEAYARAAGGAAHAVERVYSVPFLAHATMEPMCATASVGAASAELWVPTQCQSLARAAVAEVLGLPVAAVTVHTTLAGGGFGRRMEPDYSVQAARISKACGAPVKLIWSREEDIRHDFYRPAAVVKLTASVGSDGMPVALRMDTACESILKYSRRGEWSKYAKQLDASALDEPPSEYYALPVTKMHVTTVDIGVPVGFLRSVAAAYQVFATECLMDEMAQLAGVDALAYRRRMVPPGSRQDRLLELLARHADWGRAPPPGRHRGMAFSRANGSCVGHVVEVSVDAGRAVEIHRVWTVIDCGIAVNPGSVRAQVEGCVAWALTSAMYGEITIRHGAVEQSNFYDYRLLALDEMPAVDVRVVESSDPPGGAGEEAVGALAPALVNALFAATGERVRDLPLAKAGFTLRGGRGPNRS